MATREELATLFAGMAGLWPGRITPDPVAVDMAELVAADYDIAELQAAMVTRSRSGAEHPPTIGALVNDVALSLVPSYRECKPHFLRSSTPATCPPGVWAVIDAMGGPDACANSGDPTSAFPPDAAYIREHGISTEMYASAVPRAAVTIARARRDALETGTAVGELAP